MVDIERKQCKVLWIKLLSNIKIVFSKKKYIYYDSYHSPFKEIGMLSEGQQGCWCFFIDVGWC